MPVILLYSVLFSAAIAQSFSSDLQRIFGLCFTAYYLNNANVQIQTLLFWNKIYSTTEMYKYNFISVQKTFSRFSCVTYLRSFQMSSLTCTNAQKTLLGMDFQIL